MARSWFREEGQCIIGVSGALAVVNLPSLILSIRTIICDDVTVFLTEQASQMGSRNAVSAITGRPVVAGFFDSTREAIDIFRVLDAASMVLIDPRRHIHSSPPFTVLPPTDPRIVGYRQNTRCSHFYHRDRIRRRQFKIAAQVPPDPPRPPARESGRISAVEPSQGCAF